MSHSEGKQGLEHGEPPAEANAQSDTTKQGRASKSAIGKTAKQSPTRTRVAGKRTIVAPTYNNPEKKLSEKHAEAAAREEAEEGDAKNFIETRTLVHCSGSAARPLARLSR